VDNTDEDLSIAIMNLITLEEHLYFTGARTDSPEYYKLVDEVRKNRQELLDELLGETEGEVYCAVKHLLAASVRLFEVGEKFQSIDKEEKAEKYFEKAFDIYSLVWGLVSGRLEIPEDEETKDPKEVESENHTITERLKNLSDKILNCCDDF